MIEVLIPETYFSEMAFAIDVLLGDLAGLNYTLKQSQRLDYTEFKFETKSLRIQNHFFYEPLYHSSKMPVDCQRANIMFRDKKWQYTLMYGKSNISDRGETVEIHSDLIASAYFMLSRWEEMVEHKKDEYGRFDAKQAISIKNNFYHIPVVNEYASILVEIFQIMGYQEGIRQRRAQLLISHDIDITRKYKHWYNILTAGFHEGSLKAKELWQHVSKQTNPNADPYFNFSKLSSIAETKGLRLTYYFAAVKTSKSKYDIFDYGIDDKNIKEEIRFLIDKGHLIGLHPSYNSYNDEAMILDEKENLEESAGIEITSSRQHYLRYDVAKTPVALQNAGIKQDNSMHYSLGPGFRTGSCMEHSMYNISERKKLDIKQQPLVFMDTHLIEKPLEEMIDQFSKVSSQVKKHGGTMTVLWHNNNVWPENRLRKYIALIDHFQNQYN